MKSFNTSFHIDNFSAAKRDVFGLNGQIEHKLAFIRRHVPRETSLVLVGHSIGCYIILDIMKRNPKLKASSPGGSLKYQV